MNEHLARPPSRITNIVLSLLAVVAVVGVSGCAYLLNDREQLREAWEQEREELVTRVADLELHAEKLQQTLEAHAEAGQTLRELELAIDESTAQAAALEARMAEQEAQLAEKDAQLQQTLQAQAEAGQTLQELELAIDESTARAEALEAQVVEQEARLAAMAREEALTRQRYESLSEDLAAVSAELEAGDIRLQELSRSEDDLLARISELETALLDRTRTLERLGEVVARVELILGNTQEQLHAAEAELGRFPEPDGQEDAVWVR